MFAQDSKFPDRRVLLGSEVHNAEEYANYTRVYQQRSWPGALLKFTVLDNSSAPQSSTAEEDTTVAESESVAPGGSDAPHEAPTELVYDSDSPSLNDVWLGFQESDARRRRILDRIRQGTSSRTSTTSNTAVVDDNTSGQYTEFPGSLR